MKNTGTFSTKDLKPITRIISALNVLKMNIGMYPDGHASLDKSADHAYSLLREYFQGSSDINIGVTGKTLLFNGKILDKNNKNFEEYARVLNNFHVIFLKLKSSATKQELFQFSKILSSKPSDIQHMDKLEVILSSLTIKGIEVKTIDAGYFELSEEKKPRQKGSDEDFWREFIQRLASDESIPDSPNYKAGDHAGKSFMAIIQKLNTNSQLWQKAVSSYENMIEEYLNDRRHGEPITAQKYEILGAISHLIHNFHPKLKEQLLGAAQRQISIQAETAFGLENLDYLPDEMLSVIIHLADERQRQIPPALLMLLQKFSATDSSRRMHQKDSRQSMTSHEMAGILKKEKYEEYIPDQYDQLLRNLSGSSSPDREAEDRFPLSVHLKTLENEQINFSICKLVYTLLEKETDEENYVAYSKRLAESVPELLREGQFEFLIGMLETFRRHGHQGVSEEIRRQAQSVIPAITHSETIAQNVTPFILSGAENTQAAKFLVMSGEQNLPWLFDLYLAPDTPAGDMLIGVMKEFGVKAVEETAKRMTIQTPLKAIRLLALLRGVGHDSTIPLMKELYEFNDYNVKKDVLEILISSSYSDAVDLLRKSLHSSKHINIQQGVSLTVHYKVGELMDDVMSLLKTFHIREEDTILNELIVRQLGGSGSSWAVPYLEKIAAVNATISPQRLSRMKEILYDSLEKFAREDIRFLLENGSKSWNRKIRESCLKLMR